MFADSKVRKGITKFWNADRLFGYVEESTPGRIAPRYFYNVESIVPDGLFRRVMYCQPGVLVTFKVIESFDRKGNAKTKAIDVQPEFPIPDELNDDYRETSIVKNVLRVASGNVGTVFLDRPDGDQAALLWSDVEAGGDLWDSLQPGDEVYHGLAQNDRGRNPRATHAQILSRY